MAARILICGDSFAADWTVKYKDRGLGWPNLLAKDFQVKNLAQAGCGQYKIYNQLCNADLNDYDCIIISHTSAYRLHTAYHPVHSNDKLHCHADFIYNDIKEHSENCKDLICVTEYYKKYFDLDYAKFVHTLICEKINTMISHHQNVLHISNLNWKDFYQFQDMLILDHLVPVNNGMNHYNQETNNKIYQQVLNRINL